VAQKMTDTGFAEVYVLKGGWNAWKLVDYPVDPI